MTEMMTDKEAEQFMIELYGDEPLEIFFCGFGHLREAITTVSPQMKFLLLDATPIEGWIADDY